MTVKKDNPRYKNLIRQINAITLHALGILCIILDNRGLFQGMPYQKETHGSRLQKEHQKPHRWVTLEFRFWVGRKISFFGELLLLIYLHYWQLFSSASVISWPNSNYNPYSLN